MNNKLNPLSGGRNQRVAVARALVNCLAGIYPAYRASRMDPVGAIGSE